MTTAECERAQSRPRRRALGFAFVVVLAAACAASESEPGRDAAAPAEEDGAAMEPPELPDGVAGTACGRDADCASGRCATSLSIGTVSMPAPGGYCTVTCIGDAQCGAGAECAVPADAASGDCLATCMDTADCREGYLCVGAARTSVIALPGTCQPMPEADSLGDGVAGRSCVRDADCEGGQCARSIGATAFPGRYCTARCFEDWHCGAGGACLRLSVTAEPGQCFDACAADADCTRDGYRCRELNAGLQACHPAPDPLPDRGAGRACREDSECGGAGTCAEELPFRDFFSNENIAAPGGYCTQECTRDVDCGLDGQCISRGAEGGGLCLGTCTDERPCREGYVCFPHHRDRDSDATVCVPDPGSDAGAP